MRRIRIVAIILIIAGIIAIATKPSDDQSVRLIKKELQTAADNNTDCRAADDLLATLDKYSMENARGFMRVEDRIFYKDIFFFGTDQKIGTALFGTVSIDRHLVSDSRGVSASANMRSRTNDAWGGKPNPPMSNNLDTAQKQLDDAQTKLDQMKEFHLLRTPEKKQEQITRQEQYVQALTERVKKLEK